MPNKGQIKSLRKVMFAVAENLLCISPLDNGITGYAVSLQASLIWTIREMRLHEADTSDSIEFDIKLDGRPLFGKCLFAFKNTSNGRKFKSFS